MTQPPNPSSPPRAMPAYLPPGRWPPRRPWSLGEQMAVLVILLAVALLFAEPLIFRPSAAAKARVAVAEPDVELLLQARYVVGVTAILPTKTAGQSGKLLDVLGGMAKEPEDKLRVAIVRGELEDKDQALVQLGELNSRYPALAADIQTLRAMYQGALSQTSQQWRSFAARNGWFADLAATCGKPASDPLRAATLHAAIRTMVTLLASVLLVLGLAVVGLGLLIAAAVLYFSKRLSPAFDRVLPLPANRSVYLQGFAFYLALMASAGLLLRTVLRLMPLLPSPMLWEMLALLAAFAIGASWPLLRGQSWSDWRAALGLHTGRGILREVAAGAAGYVAGIPILIIGLLLTLLLVKLSGLDATHPIVKQLAGSRPEVLLIFILASIYAPITEELMFRGALLGHLRERYGFWFSAVTVSLLFAIIHPQGWPALPALASLALVFAGLREWRGSIIPCMIAHAINNTLVLIVVLLMIS